MEYLNPWALTQSLGRRKTILSAHYERQAKLQGLRGDLCTELRTLPVVFQGAIFLVSSL